MTNLIKGIDISAIQETINWPSVAAAGYEFMISRCGIGNDGIDALFKQNVAGASEHNIKTALYHFVYPLPLLSPNTQPLRDPTAQAQYHFNAAQNITSVVCCDLEWPYQQNWNQWQCSPSQIVDWTITYLEAYTKLSGISPLIYSYPSFLSAISASPQYIQITQNYKLWIASYTNSPVSVPGWGTNWTLWQNSGGSVSLPGTATPVDTDYAKDLSLWGVQAQTPTPSVPVVNTIPQPDNNSATDTVAAPAPVSTVLSTVASGALAPSSSPTVPANPTPEPHPSSVLQTIENLEQPGILSAIGAFIGNLLKLLFSIK